MNYYKIVDSEDKFFYGVISSRLHPLELGNVIRKYKERCNEFDEGQEYEWLLKSIKKADRDASELVLTEVEF